MIGDDGDELLKTRAMMERQFLARRVHLGEHDRLKRRDHTDRIPLSFAQESFWVLQQVEPSSAAYNVPVISRIRGPFHIEACRAALNAIMARHDVLRTTFLMAEGGLVQVVNRHAVLEVPLIELQQSDRAEKEEWLRQELERNAKQPFDLSRDLMIRAVVFQLDPSEHVLSLVLHHIACDGWAIGILNRELTELYTAKLTGGSASLPPLPIQYADFAVWQRETIAQRLDVQLSYWRDQLAGAIPTELHADKPRPAIRTHNGAKVWRVLPADLVGRIIALSRSEGTSLFMTVLAAFQVVLTRYTQQKEIVLGTPFAGRNRVETEKLIGVFTNSVVLRTDVTGNPTYRELLGRVRDCVLNAFEHGDVPFEKVVEALRPERDPSRTPLFQIFFVMQNLPDESRPLEGLVMTPEPVESTHAKFDLTLVVAERDGGLRASFVYNQDLFEEATIGRLMDHLETVLQSVVANPDQRVSDIALLTPAEKHQLLVEWNDTQQAFSQYCVHHIFEAQVERTPEAIAAVWNQERISYRELNCRANRVANYLRKHGVGPEVLVGICVERSLDMLVGILGILKSGAAYVPLDPSYPKDRLGFILQDSQAHVVLTQEALGDILPSHAAQAIYLDKDWKAIAAESEHEPSSAVNPQNLAYVLFTSGSTGRPKGVALEHRSAATFIQWAQTVFTAEELAGTLFSTSMCFDLSIFEMFVPLSVGGKIILAQNVLSLPQLAAVEEVTLINTIPSAMAELLRIQGVPKSVVTVNLAGETLSSSLVRDIYDQTHAGKVYNLYGPTEATTYSTYTLVERGAEVTIGRPIANTQAYILDRFHQPVPVRVPGELYLAGEGLARGYFGQPERTAERFFPSPFSSESRARMYRTGDLCRYLEDGIIEYLGRIDTQVKLRGYRIELGEIETLLAQHPSVQHAVALVREDVAGDKRLVAYLVAAAGQQISASELRSYLKQSLPDYMLPNAFVKIESLPLTPSGKVNRHVLPPPEAADVPGGQERVAPRTPTEELLAGIWAEVLRRDSFGVHDNFFDLGGHSLLAVRLISEIKRVTAKNIPLSVLFRGATIEYLASVLQEEDLESSFPLCMQLQGGARAPLFCVVAPGRNALGYVSLARHLDTDQPLYKLQAPHPERVDRPYTTAEYKSLTAEYVASMRTVQPKGPYLLAGMCEGAYIAFEMARFLEAEGEEVALLGIFDTWVLENIRIRFLWQIDQYCKKLRSFWGLSLREKREILNRWWRNRTNHGEINNNDMSNPWPAAYWPGKDFVPPRFEGKIALFKLAHQPYYHVRDPLMGWGARSQGVELHVVDIREKKAHLLLFREPYVSALAEQLQECLHRSLSGQDLKRKFGSADLLSHGTCIVPL